MHKPPFQSCVSGVCSHLVCQPEIICVSFVLFFFCLKQKEICVWCSEWGLSPRSLISLLVEHFMAQFLLPTLKIPLMLFFFFPYSKTAVGKWRRWRCLWGMQVLGAVEKESLFKLLAMHVVNCSLGLLQWVVIFRNKMNFIWWGTGMFSSVGCSSWLMDHENLGHMRCPLWNVLLTRCWSAAIWGWCVGVMWPLCCVRGVLCIHES